jgi:hypothetical protein
MESQAVWGRVAGRQIRHTDQVSESHRLILILSANGPVLYSYNQSEGVEFVDDLKALAEQCGSGYVLGLGKPSGLIRCQPSERELEAERLRELERERLRAESRKHRDWFKNEYTRDQDAWGQVVESAETVAKDCFSVSDTAVATVSLTR